MFVDNSGMIELFKFKYIGGQMGKYMYYEVICG